MTETIFAQLDRDRYDLQLTRQDKDAITGHWPPPALGAWLGRLTLLYGVPFQYLIPDERMLPRESLRIFFVDQAWIEAMIDGALSIGRPENTRVLFRQALNGDFTQNLVTQARAIRGQERQRRGASDEDDHAAEDARDRAEAAGGSFRLCGFFMRSEIVSGWRGLEIAAFRQPGGRHAEGNERIPPLRLERLGPDVLMGLFATRPGSLEFTPPPEGLHFHAGEHRRSEDGSVDVEAWTAAWADGAAGSARLADALIARPKRHRLDLPVQ